MALTLLQPTPAAAQPNSVSATSARARATPAATSTGSAPAPGCDRTIGCFVIYSASRTKQADPYQYVTRQVVFLIASTLFMIVVMSVDYESLRERARFFYGVTIMLLVLVVVAGTVSSGARLSFDVGPVKLQPAEFAKATVLLALAAYLAEERSDEVSYPALPRRADHGRRPSR
jgi:hypothetical protein